MSRIEELQTFIASERELLLRHPLYERISTVEDLQAFTEGHVYAVWDFMSLLKALQVQLTCTSVPWFASSMPNTRYLINEIVLAEESDLYIDGRRLSHFEMYLDAMSVMGANTNAIEDFIQQAKASSDIHEVIQKASLDQRVKDFLIFTFSVIQTGKAHQIAAAFTFGREDLIPDMFTSILKELQAKSSAVDMSKFIYYFQRHIELDGDEHGPLAMQMITELAGDDEQKWQEMQDVALQALQVRSKLWDAIADHIA
ncbi:DUF3050 domain-containing protein [Sphingobacterium sp. lm-10]|uniref:DUF3050 domain-containing protein n=1 Tax=Sphingobacterium sp. lm-10 TaxID=2944904 RepID=UPI00201FE32B|nr:DUF3050 domain-containing protein [Sphingobacterium sp. lm-10]MCL7987022.1 DUF3050 domain-containing protein [Sphingobacterium sp. lm-10]